MKHITILASALSVLAVHFCFAQHSTTVDKFPGYEDHKSRRDEFKRKMASGDFEAAMHFLVNIIEPSRPQRAVDEEQRAYLYYELGQYRQALDTYSRYVTAFLAKNPRADDERKGKFAATQLIMNLRFDSRPIDWVQLRERFPNGALPEMTVGGIGTRSLQDFRFSFAAAVRSELVRMDYTPQIKMFDRCSEKVREQQGKFLRGEIDVP